MSVTVTGNKHTITLRRGDNAGDNVVYVYRYKDVRGFSVEVDRETAQPPCAEFKLTTRSGSNTVTTRFTFKRIELAFDLLNSFTEVYNAH